MAAASTPDGPAPLAPHRRPFAHRRNESFVDNAIRSGCASNASTMDEVGRRKAEEAANRRFQAAAWITSMAGPLDMPFEPSEEEFRLCLRNGLILCSLINKVQPGAVPKVVENIPSLCPEGQPLSAYQYFENVRNFLVAVEELKLPNFEASDLEQGSLQPGSTTKIVDCILALKSYYEWKKSGGNGSWKYAGLLKSPMILRNTGSPQCASSCTFGKASENVSNPTDGTPMGLAQSHVKSDDLNTCLLKDPVSQSEDEECGISGKILYRATFDEIENNYVNYDTVLWILISLLLILAWGIGVLMLIYLPIRRYILRQDIHSRTLYVTSHAIVYKVTRPAFLPCLGFTTMEKHVLLPLVTDVIIEQGCLQAVYGIHTIRVENLAHGKSTPVDEFQIQGVVNPRLFRKVILAEASKFGKETRISGKTVAYYLHNQDGAVADLSLENAHDVHRSQSSSLRIPCLAQNIPTGNGSVGSSDTLLLHKLDEVERSVKRIEALVEHSLSSEALPRLSA